MTLLCDRFPYLNFSNSNDSLTYKRKTPKGKVIIVRKGRRSKAENMAIRSAELLGTAAGLIVGAKVGSSIVKATGVNGTVLRSAKLGGGLAGGAIALMLADRVEKKYAI